MRCYLTFTDGDRTQDCVAEVEITDSSLEILKTGRLSVDHGARGLASWRGQLYVVTNDGMSVFDENLNEIRHVDFHGEHADLSDGHGLFRVGSTLYACYSKTSTIAHIDSECTIITKTSVPKARGDIHANSVWIDRGDIYVTVHNRDEPGYVLRRDMWTGDWRHVCEGLSQPHDYQTMPDGYCVCDSNRQSFVARYSDNRLYSVNCGHFTRGLLRDGNTFYVGSTDRSEDNILQVHVVREGAIVNSHRVEGFQRSLFGIWR